MNNNEDKKYGKIDYFELREKRLKLVYKVLYVVVALWIASLACFNKSVLTYNTIPFYSALLATTSLVIINILKYALMEFRCMKVYGSISDEILKTTEEKYDLIWKSFAVILSVIAFLMMIHINFLSNLKSSVLIVVFSVFLIVTSLYFAVVSVIDFFNKKHSEKASKILYVIDVFAGNLTAYSVCALMGLVMIS